MEQIYNGRQYESRVYISLPQPLNIMFITTERSIYRTERQHYLLHPITPTCPAFGV